MQLFITEDESRLKEASRFSSQLSQSAAQTLLCKVAWDDIFSYQTIFELFLVKIMYLSGVCFYILNTNSSVSSSNIHHKNIKSSH